MLLVVVNDDDAGLLVLVIMDVAAGVLLLLALDPGYADDDGIMESWRGAPFVLMR